MVVTWRRRTPGNRTWQYRDAEPTARAYQQQPASAAFRAIWQAAPFSNLY
jgi:hypothetical protein